mmetsp:Transcript_115357/g.182261  ORF Transcript_115357/g.182261 Transcript_115357/m.182261 type:complete len:157 (-) Transcript_115357:127-597(-)
MSSLGKSKTAEEMEALRTRFAYFDIDDNGRIKLEELKEIMAEFGHTELQVRDWIHQADSNGDGVIDFREFVDLVERKNQELKDCEELMGTFKQFDVNGNGFIERNEWFTVMRTMAESLDEEELEEMFIAADTNNDGKVSYQEFVDSMVSQSMMSSW